MRRGLWYTDNRNTGNAGGANENAAIYIHDRHIIQKTFHGSPKKKKKTGRRANGDTV